MEEAEPRAELEVLLEKGPPARVLAGAEPIACWQRLL